MDDTIRILSLFFIGFNGIYHIFVQILIDIKWVMVYGYGKIEITTFTTRTLGLIHSKLEKINPMYGSKSHTFHWKYR